MNFLDVLNTLTEDGVEFVIVGGVAARLHGSTRLTHDLDIVPKLDDVSWKRLIQSTSFNMPRPSSHPNQPEPVRIGGGVVTFATAYRMREPTRNNQNWYWKMRYKHPKTIFRKN